MPVDILHMIGHIMDLLNTVDLCMLVDSQNMIHHTVDHLHTVGLYTPVHNHYNLNCKEDRLHIVGLCMLVDNQSIALSLVDLRYMLLQSHLLLRSHSQDQMDLLLL